MQRQARQAEGGGQPLSPEEAEAQAIQDAKDAETIQELERARAKFQDEQRQAREAFAAEEARKQEAFEAEEKRKDKESESELERAEKMAAAQRKAKLQVMRPTSRSTTPERPAKKKANGESKS